MLLNAYQHKRKEKKRKKKERKALILILQKSEEKPKIPQIKSHTQKLKQSNKSRERETYWWDGGRTYEKWTQSFSEWGAQDQVAQANQRPDT